MARYNTIFNLESELWDFIVTNYIATEGELRLVTDICGYSENALNDVIFARTGYRSYEQCVDAGYEGTTELNDYYNI